MSVLKINEYWWIEKEDGELLEFGRHLTEHGLTDCGCPNPKPLKKYIKKLLREGEKAVKVKLILA